MIKRRRKKNNSGKLRKTGAQLLILLALNKKGAMDIIQLERAMADNIEVAQFYVTIYSLEEKEYIQVIYNFDNRRVYSVTPGGKVYLEELLQDFEAFKKAVEMLRS